MTAFMLCVATATRAAEVSNVLGQFENWTAMTATDQGKKVCFISSEPTQSQGKYKKRDKVIAFITNRPDQDAKDVFSHVAGYSFKTGATVNAKIGDKNFKLFTKEDTAWTPDKDTDTAMVGAMMKGRDMVITGSSARGTKTTDTYSLKGVSAAYDAMKKACN